MIRLMNGAHTVPMNIGNPDEFTIRKLAELVRARINPALSLIEKPLPEDDPMLRKPVIDLAREHLKWLPTVQLDQGLKQTIAYIQQHFLHIPVNRQTDAPIRPTELISQRRSLA